MRAHLCKIVRLVSLAYCGYLYDRVLRERKEWSGKMCDSMRVICESKSSGQLQIYWYWPLNCVPTVYQWLLKLSFKHETHKKGVLLRQWV
jgi:hypothetical protein